MHAPLPLPCLVNISRRQRNVTVHWSVNSTSAPSNLCTPSAKTLLSVRNRSFPWNEAAVYLRMERTVANTRTRTQQQQQQQRVHDCCVPFQARLQFTAFCAESAKSIGACSFLLCLCRKRYAAYHRLFAAEA
jgi:hypothetical protein